MSDTILRNAIEAACDSLAEWLCDNTEEVFEEQPEIDGIRAKLQDALDEDEKERKAKPRDERQTELFPPPPTERDLLRACQYFLNMLPNEQHPGCPGYGDSYALAAALDRYFNMVRA